MYEKIVEYFEKNLCIENIYFRKHYLLWFIGIIVTLIIEMILNSLIVFLISNRWASLLIFLAIDSLITGIVVVLTYAIPLKRIYNQKVKDKTYFDFLGILMDEELLTAYRETEIEEMDHFLREQCEIKNVDDIKLIIEVINEELADKYEKKNFIEKYFITIILPIIVLILSVYLTNNNEQNLTNIIFTTIVSFISIIVVCFCIFKIKNIKITPVNKRENLLELKRVLTDIILKWGENFSKNASSLALITQRDNKTQKTP